MSDRKNIAKEFQNHSENVWSIVIFCDKSKFNIFGPESRDKIWRNRNEEMNPKFLIPPVKHGGGSGMVWGCMASSGFVELVFIEKPL